MNKKHLSVFGIPLIIVCILTVVYIVGKNSNQMKPLDTLSQMPPRGTSIEGPLYLYESGKISDILKSDTYFLQCLSKSASQCSVSSASGSSQIFTGAYVQMLDAMQSVQSKDSLDACFSDSLRNCVPYAIKEQEQQALDPIICDSYPDIIQRSTCKNEVLRKLAVKNDDVSVCVNIEDAFQKTYCQDTYHLYKSENTEDPSWCDRIAEETQKNMCKSSLLSRVAIARKKPEKCQGYVDDIEKDACLLNFINQTHPPTLEKAPDCSVYDAYITQFKDAKKIQTISTQCNEMRLIQSMYSNNSGSIVVLPAQSDIDAICNSYPEVSKRKECKIRFETIINTQKKRISEATSTEIVQPSQSEVSPLSNPVLTP